MCQRIGLHCSVCVGGRINGKDKLSTTGYGWIGEGAERVLAPVVSLQKLLLHESTEAHKINMQKCTVFARPTSLPSLPSLPSLQSIPSLPSHWIPTPSPPYIPTLLDPHSLPSLLETRPIPTLLWILTPSPSSGIPTPSPFSWIPTQPLDPTPRSHPYSPPL